MLARNIAQKIFSLFQTFFLLLANKKNGVEGFSGKPSTPFFYLLIFHRGGWGCESKKSFGMALSQPLSGTRELIFDLSLYICPFFVYLNSEGSDKTADLHRLTRGQAGPRQ